MPSSPRKKPSDSSLVIALLLAVITASLVACGDPPSEIIPALTLTVNKTNLPDGGGEVVLTAKVTNEATVTSVTFKADKGAAIPPVTTPNKAGDFVTTVSVAETTKFTAEAAGPGGVWKSPAEGTTVTVALPDPKNDPKAPSSSLAVKGFANMTLTTGNPSGLSVVVSSIPGVTGEIDGQVKAETVKSSKGLDVTIEAGDGVLTFSYPAGSAGKDSFQYTVTKTSREAKGKIDIDIQAIPGDIEVIDGNDTVNTINNSSKPVILLAKDVICTRSDICITLDSGQTLTGTLNVDGVTITNSVKPKIIANMPGTRKSGTAFCGTVAELLAVNPDAFTSGEEYDPRPNCTETRVIELADNVTIEGIEITSSSTDESSTYFTAMFAKADGNNHSETLDGRIVIKDVTITRSNGKPIYVQYQLNGSPSVYADYEMEIEGLILEDANDTLVLGNPKRLLFKDSSIELVQPEGNNAGPQPFGDNVGVQIASYISGDITIDNVDVFMESTRYRIDFRPEGTNAVPFEIVNFRSGAAVSLTVKNTDVVFGDILASDVAAFKVKGETGTVTINQGASVNNTATEGSSNTPGINRIGNVSGTIQFN
jgi:hypothetical protein